MRRVVHARLESSDGITAVVVRVHSGTSDAMLQRHIFWASQLERATERGGLQTCFWVLVDETFGDNAVRNRLTTLAASAHLSSVRFLPYNEADMANTFSVLAELRASLPNTQDVRDCFTLPCRKSLAWGFHVEAILVWWRHVTDRPGPTPAFVWILEDDAGFSGDISEFAMAYADSDTDLLVHGLRPVDSSWVWCSAASPAFGRRCGTRQWRCAEHVQRFSAALLRELDRCSSSGVAAWSEMAVPSLCAAAGLSFAELRAEHLGAVFAFNGVVPESAWPRLCEQLSTRNRWWHALKW